jgi:hypothetical protein
MSFFKKLFGGGKTDAANDGPAASEDYAGFTLSATPFAQAGGFQLSGVISKEIDGARKEHRFVRADRFPAQDEAVQFTLKKARQLVDEQGDNLFR